MRFLDAVGGRATFLVREDEGPHPRGRVGLEDAPHNRAVRQHVEVIVLPFTGRAGGRCAFEDEIILFHRVTVCHAQESP